MIEFIIDYFRVTVHDTTSYCVDLYDEYFKDFLGPLSDSTRGAKGYKGSFESSLGFQLKHTPGAERIYCTYEFPGQACKAIPPELFGLFYSTLELEEPRFTVNRIDLAFDGVEFSPRQLYDTILEDANRKADEEPIVRSLTQRESLDLRFQPLKVKEDNSSTGRETCYFGSRYSERYLRLYNMRGPNRLEVEYKDGRAGTVAEDLFSHFKDTDSFYEIAISHLRDFIDIDLPWWHQFIQETDRAYATVHNAKDVTIERKKLWLLSQVAPTAAAINEVSGGRFLGEMEIEGRKRMYKSCSTLLNMHREGAVHEC